MRSFITVSILLICFFISPLFIIREASLISEQMGTNKAKIKVRMAWEKIEITRTSKDKIHTRVTYGFTGTFEDNMELAFPETEWFKLENFKTYFNSTQLPINKVSAASNQYFALGKYRYVALHCNHVPQQVLTANSGENRVINEYDYTSPFFSSGTKTDIPLPSGKYIEYTLVTGSTWSGDIGKLDVIFESGTSCDKIFELPNSYKGNCQNGIWLFSANHIKPDKNIELVLVETDN